MGDVTERGPGHNAGTNGFRLFIDTIEETRARGALASRKKIVGRPKKLLGDLLVKHFKMAEQLRKQLDKVLTLAKRADENWIPDEGFMETFKVVTDSITKLDRSIRLGREQEMKARQGLSEEQLEAVWKTELRRIATKLDEEDWRVLLSIGMGEDIAEAALTVFRERQASYRAARKPTQFSEDRQPDKERRG